MARKSDLRFGRVNVEFSRNDDRTKFFSFSNNNSNDMKNNRNVALALAFSALSSCARGVWSFVTATNYLRLLGSVDSVGVAEGMQGLSQALFAVLAGVAADKSSRDRVLKAAGMVGSLSVVCTLFALFADFDWVTTARRFDMVVVALVCWGAYQGIWTTSLESIFADSVKTEIARDLTLANLR